MSANSSIGEVRSFGQTYFVRKSVQQILQSVAQSPGSRTVASSSSSSSSSAASLPTNDRPKTRLCLYWDLVNDYDIVLLMATFNGINPMVKQRDGGSIIPNVPFDTLLKHLVSIFPTSSIAGRRSINMKFIDSSNERRTEHQENFFLILAPVIINGKDRCGRKYDGFFSKEDLCYIRQLLSELDEEKFRNKVSNRDLPSQTIQTVSSDPVMRSVITSLNRRKIPVFSSYMTSFYVTVLHSPYCWVRCYGPYTEPFCSTWAGANETITVFEFEHSEITCGGNRSEELKPEHQWW